MLTRVARMTGVVNQSPGKWQKEETRPIQPGEGSVETAEAVGRALHFWELFMEPTPFGFGQGQIVSF